MNGNGSPHDKINTLIALQSFNPDKTMVALGELMDPYAGKEYGGKIKGGIPMHMPSYSAFMKLAGMENLPIVSDSEAMQILNKLNMGDVPGGLVSYLMSGEEESRGEGEKRTGEYSPASKYYPDVPDTIKIWRPSALEHEPLHSIGKHHTESGELSYDAFNNYNNIMFRNLIKGFGGYDKFWEAKEMLMSGKDIRPKLVR